MGQIFSTSEPMSAHLKIGQEDISSVTDQFLSPDYLDTYDVSYLAEDISLLKPTIIAFVVCAPFDQKFDKDIVASKMAPILKLIDALDHHFFMTYSGVAPQNVLHLLMGGTKNGYEGLGISKNLREFVFEAAIKMGKFNYCIAECSSVVTQHIMSEHFGFKKEFEILYKNFEFQEKKIFEGIVPHNGVALMVKKFDGDSMNLLGAGKS